jgi:hypothetical protein
MTGDANCGISRIERRREERLASIMTMQPDTMTSWQS